MEKEPCRKRLEACYEALCGQTLDIWSSDNDADGDTKDRLLRWEADLAGIAQRLMDCVSLESAHYEWLSQPVLLGTAIQFGRYFYNPDGPYDVAHMPDVLAYAQTVEELRRACADYLAN